MADSPLTGRVCDGSGDLLTTLFYLLNINLNWVESDPPCPPFRLFLGKVCQDDNTEYIDLIYSTT